MVKIFILPQGYTNFQKEFINVICFYQLTIYFQMTLAIGVVFHLSYRSECMFNQFITANFGNVQKMKIL